MAVEMQQCIMNEKHHLYGCSQNYCHINNKLLKNFKGLICFFKNSYDYDFEHKPFDYGLPIKNLNLINGDGNGYGYHYE